MDGVDELLMAAVDAGDLESVKQWIQRHPGRLDSVRDERGRTPLHRAAATDHYQLAAFIDREMSDPYSRDDRGLLAIDYPPGEKETGARRILRLTWAGQQKSLGRLLETPHETPDVRLISQPADAWRRTARQRLLPGGMTPLMIACGAGRADLVKRLLANGFPG